MFNRSSHDRFTNDPPTNAPKDDGNSREPPKKTQDTSAAKEARRPEQRVQPRAVRDPPMAASRVGPPRLAPYSKMRRAAEGGSGGDDGPPNSKAGGVRGGEPFERHPAGAVRLPTRTPVRLMARGTSEGSGVGQHPPVPLLGPHCGWRILGPKDWWEHSGVSMLVWNSQLGCSVRSVVTSGCSRRGVDLGRGRRRA